MTETILAPLRDLHLTDVVDVLVVTALVSTAVVWIRRTQAALVAVGIIILGLMYLGARALGLQLTAWIFQGFFAIFLIIIVVIFQEELRQFFERIAVWSLRRDRHPVLPSDVADVIVSALADLARQRIGALVVLPGTQPIDRHVRGGIALDGKLTGPLLKSIFEPHSPGHDGAVIITDDQISRFAAHLPLSTDFRQLSGVGTRHSAALGLAELTDALCLVVSEERGRISVAQHGRLRQLADEHELGAVVRGFLAARQPPSRPRRVWERVFRENWLEKLASLIVVLGLWYFFVQGSRPTQVSFDLPVRVINMPPGYELEKVEPETVEAVFSAPARAFYLLDRRGLEVTVDATRTKPGRARTLEISEQNLRHPKDLTLVELRPARVVISARKGPVEGGPQAGGGR